MSVIFQFQNKETFKRMAPSINLTTTFLCIPERYPDLLHNWLYVPII